MTWQSIDTFKDFDGVVPVLVSDGARVYYATCSVDDGWYDETTCDADDRTIFGVIKWMPLPAP